MIKLKSEDGKHAIEVRNEVQAVAFLNAKFKPATKADAEKLAELQGKKEVVVEE